MRRVIGVAMLAAVVPAMALAQDAPMTKAEYCEEMLATTRELLMQATTVMAATDLEGFMETGEAAPADPRVGDSVMRLAETVDKAAEHVVAFCGD